MTYLARLLLIAAAPIAAFFVGRDAPHFGLVQSLVVMLFITILVVWIAWIPPRKRGST